MTWREVVSNLSNNVFPKVCSTDKGDCDEYGVKSSLPLQMSAYFNVIFIPVWLIVMFLFLIDKYNNLSRLVQVIIITIVCTIIIVEILRMYMLYEGNLKDKIPELAGFWMLSVFLQLPLQGILLFNPFFQFSVLETVCQSIIFIMLNIQIIYGYAALRYIASQQAKYYKFRRQDSKKFIEE